MEKEAEERAREQRAAARAANCALNERRAADELALQARAAAEAAARAEADAATLAEVEATPLRWAAAWLTLLLRRAEDCGATVWPLLGPLNRTGGSSREIRS